MTSCIGIRGSTGDEVVLKKILRTLQRESLLKLLRNSRKGGAHPKLRATLR